MHEPELAIEDDQDGEATTKIQPAEVMAILEEGEEDTTRVHRYQPETPRGGWLRRLFGWFTRD